jgi:hypothetical protein
MVVQIGKTCDARRAVEMVNPSANLLTGLEGRLPSEDLFNHD